MRRLLPGLRERAADRQYGLGRRVLNLERAPVKATVIAVPVKKAAPMATPPPVVDGALFLLVDEGEAFDTRIYARGSWVEQALLPERPYNASSGNISGYGDVVIATRNQTVRVSADRCATFAIRVTPIADEDVDMSGVDRSGVVWAVAETGSDPTHSLWKSVDQGSNWTEVQADFEFTRGLSFGTTGFMAAWDVSSFAGSIFGGQVRLSDDNGATFDAKDTDDVVASGDERIRPLRVHYLGSGRIALTYTFEDTSGTPDFEVRAVWLDSGSWTTPVAVTSLSGSSPGSHSVSKSDEIAVALWDGDGALEVWTSPDSEAWTELAAITGTFCELAYDTAGVLHAYTSNGLFAYVDGDWVEDETIPADVYGVFGIPEA